MAKFASLTASAVLVPTVVVGLISAAAASEYRCVHGDRSVRRVEVAEAPAQNMPCEVVYWKDTEQPGVRSVLWSAQSNAAYCTRNAEQLVAKLEAGGWSCAPVEGAPKQAARATTPSIVELPPAKPEAETAGAAGAARLEAARDETTEDEPTEPERPAVRAAPAPQTFAPQADAGTAGETEDKPGGAVFGAIIEENLVRLNHGTEGRFAAEIGGHGDLDGDGLEDGVVFFTYKSERLKQARFVAVYLYDGERYALAAIRPVAGSDDDIYSAQIDAIDGGVISLRLSVLEPGDASCCPTGQRQQRLVLRDGQLVELTSSASQMPGQAAQTWATKPAPKPLALAVPGAADSGGPEERANSAADERAVGAAGRQAETDAESREPSLAPAARSGVATGGSPVVNTGMPEEAKRTERQPTTDRGAGTQIDALQATPGAAAGLQVASEASSLRNRPAADIRVFIHHVAHDQGDAALARQLADHLRRRGFNVADIRPVDFRIGKPSVRYFFARDRAASLRLVEEVERFFEETPAQAPDEASDFTHFVPKPRPGNVEVWLAIS